jgi:hypothetical protein
VQQKQGRVSPTLQLKGMMINDDARLENEARIMGHKALSFDSTAAMPTRNNAPYLPNTHFQPKMTMPVKSTPLTSGSIIQRNESKASVSKKEGIEVDLIGDLTTISLNYAIAYIRKQLPSAKTVLKDLLINMLSRIASSLIGIYDWLRQAINALKMLAGIDRGVIAVFLWGIGKIIHWIANKFYNGGILSSVFGDVAETTILGLVSVADKTHKTAQQVAHEIDKGTEPFVNALSEKIEGFLDKTNKYLGLDTSKKISEDDSNLSTVTNETPTNSDDQKKFIDVRVGTPTLDKWEGSDQATQAGLTAKASARLRLFDQDIGGDFDFRLPFGPGWEVEVSRFFESSSLSTGWFEFKNIKGDSLTFNDQGLVLAKMSINGIEVAGGVVEAASIAVEYSRYDESLVFIGEGKVNINGNDQTKASVRLIMGTNGKFIEAQATLLSNEKINLFDDHLTVSKPQGSLAIYTDKAPEGYIGADFEVKNLPAGMQATASGGVSYRDKKLSAHLRQLHIVIPLPGGTTVRLALFDAVFNSDYITADQAYTEVDHESETGKDLGGSVGGISKLKGSQKLKNIKIPLKQGVDRSWENDGGIKLGEFQGHLLGVTAHYKADESGKGGSGSLAGSISKNIKMPSLGIDFPIVVGAGASIDMGGELGFSAKINGTLTSPLTTPQKEAPEKIKVQGNAKAKAYSALKLSVSGFVGIPHLATLKAGAFGKVSGSLAGNMQLGGDIVYDQEKNGFRPDSENVHGKFTLNGELSAHLGAEIKAKVLVFKRKLKSIRLSDYNIGKYQLEGMVSSDENGKPTFTVNKPKRIGSQEEKIKTRTKRSLKNITVDNWAKLHKKQSLEAGTTSNATADESKNSADDTKDIQKIARDIVFGDYSVEKKEALYDTCLDLYKNDPNAKGLFEIAYETYNNVKTHSTVIWSEKTWEAALDTDFSGIEKTLQDAEQAPPRNANKKTSKKSGKRLNRDYLEQLSQENSKPKQEFRNARSKNFIHKTQRLGDKKLGEKVYEILRMYQTLEKDAYELRHQALILLGIHLQNFKGEEQIATAKQLQQQLAFEFDAIKIAEKKSKNEH